VSTPTAASIPIIDISRFRAGPIERAALIEQLRGAAHVYGFFYVVGHGVPSSVTDGVIGAARRFFSLPLVDRVAIDNIKSPQFRGYTRVGNEYTQGKPDRRDQLDIGAERTALELGPDDPAYLRLIGPNQWPDAAPWLRPTVLAWFDEAERTSKEVLRALAVVLGQEESWFEPWFDDEASTHLKVAHYPGSEHHEREQGLGAHKDYGWLALVLQDDFGGLEALGPDGLWAAAPPVHGAFVFNIGEMLEVATDGYLRAAVHRVATPPAGADRISVPFFLGPRLDAVVPRLDLPPELALRARGVEDDPSNPLLAQYGENALLGWLRSHPEAAARWYSDVLAAS
jgi:isopenicillin N synthase-like dioxygenase